MDSIKNRRILDVLAGNPVDKTPVWIMRQAGRYLPEYKKTRAEAGSFLDLCKTPELASEVTVQPIRRFDLDAAIIFSDILTIPDAMGLELKFEDNRGPYFDTPLNNLDDVSSLTDENNSSLEYVADAIIHTKEKLNNEVPLIGFSGSPWTLSTYMIEGAATKEFRKIRSIVFNDADMLNMLTKKLVKSISEYLIMQAKAGANILMIFDSWGGLLNSNNYIDFSLNPMKEIISNLRKDKITKNTPIVLFTKGGGNWLNEISKSGCNAIGLDWTIDIASARKIVGENICLQGNLDPCALHGSKESIQNAASKIIDSYGFGHKHIFNLGHGIDQFVNPDNLNVLIKHVKDYSVKYHNH
ncbi:MAG: uroporphyrinogen decarboxylase [Gammaproteobacteria bacterium]|nr:uroporphyrinogen decarboxylase [Gammaproteobacteria bacterium]|tara:strand:+ start:9040 stop:10104 length:1065 start_codon:yes stop_codon:yes gene_type:complete